MRRRFITALVGALGALALLVPAPAADATSLVDGYNTWGPWTNTDPVGATAGGVAIQAYANDAQIVVRGSTNRVYALHVDISDAWDAGYQAGNWRDLGGATHLPAKVGISSWNGVDYSGSPTLTVIVVGTDNNTYVRRFERYSQTWGPWLAHSVGQGWYNAWGGLNTETEHLTIDPFYYGYRHTIQVRPQGVGTVQYRVFTDPL